MLTLFLDLYRTLNCVRIMAAQVLLMAVLFVLWTRAKDKSLEDRIWISAEAAGVCRKGVLQLAKTIYTRRCGRCLLLVLTRGQAARVLSGVFSAV